MYLVAITAVDGGNCGKGRKFQGLDFSCVNDRSGENCPASGLSYLCSAKITELDKKIKVGIVSYRNTRPLIYGLQHTALSNDIELIEDIPARLADKLKTGEIDLGLVPVAVIPQLGEYHIIGDYCIGTEGEVASVCLFSEVPLNEITRVYLDYQSRSSVALLQWLMRESWGIFPEIIQAEDESYREEIKGTTAGLVIGDRALEQRLISTYIYDLGAEWRAITGLPFVFAAWVSTKSLPESFVQRFNEANAAGIPRIDEIVAANPFPVYDLRKYYTLNLSYQLDERKRKGLELFLSYLQREKEEPVAEIKEF
ncbi:MAG: menaquinone biosynthesis protein [Terrimonas ferruginea]|nr:menaquinone biosynthesis protein [Terrimonas ferruginea]